MKKITIKNNPRMYHETVVHMIDCALKIKETDSYSKMISTISGTQLKSYIDIIREEPRLPKEAEQECVMRTLIESRNTSAKEVGIAEI